MKLQDISKKALLICGVICALAVFIGVYVLLVYGSKSAPMMAGVGGALIGGGCGLGSICWKRLVQMMRHTPEEMAEIDRQGRICERDERNIRIRERVGKVCGSIMFMVWMLGMIALGVAQNNVPLLILVVILVIFTGVLQILLINYYSKKM